MYAGGKKGCIYFARTIRQVLKFNVVILRIYNGLLFVPSAVYVSLVVSFVAFIGDLFSVAVRHRCAGSTRGDIRIALP